MKGQSTASTIAIDDRKRNSQHARPHGGVASRARKPFAVTAQAPRTRIDHDVALASVSAWTHTIVLTGALTHGSAHELEVEIEQRCAEGVTAIELDVSELTYIDPIGVAVVAFRSRLCRRRGYDFSLVAGSPMMCRAFAYAGVETRLADASRPDSARVRPLELAQRARESEV
jgi:anti-anti-sigma factor